MGKWKGFFYELSFQEARNACVLFAVRLGEGKQMQAGAAKVGKGQTVEHSLDHIKVCLLS